MQLRDISRLVAVRQAPDATGTQAGTLDYLLSDHLGSTVGLLDTGGNVVPNSKTTYWPYGALRTGGVSPTTQTDKQFTRQRIENGDLQLGLYNYNARFYSTYSGTFVSADTNAKDGLDRYAYVRSNPLRLVDPSGLDAVIYCGVTETCEHGDIDSFRSWVIEYWRQHEHIFGEYGYDRAFEMLRAVTALGWAPSRVLAAFHVAFFDTAVTYASAFKLLMEDQVTDALAGYEAKFWNLHSERTVDTLIGFSLGGSVVARILEHAWQYYHPLFQPTAAILIQPGFRGWDAGGFPSGLTAADAPGTRILTVNDPASPIGGTIPGALDITAHDCHGHCSDQQEAAFAMWASMQPANSSGDNWIGLVADFFGVDVALTRTKHFPWGAGSDGSV